MNADIIFFICATALLTLLCILTIRYTVRYGEAVKLAKAERRLAKSREEKICWNREIMDMRISFIPGLDPRKVKRIRAFLISKKNKGGSSLPLIYASMISALISSLCLAGTTFAWFSSTATAGAGVISAADFKIEAEVFSLAGGTEEKLYPTSGIYSLPVGEYKIILSANGTASRGYCALRFGASIDEWEYIYSEDMAVSDEITLFVTMNQENALSFVSEWGSCSASERLSDLDIYTYN